MGRTGIRYAPMDSSEWSVRGGDGTPASVSITNLTPSTEYKVDAYYISDAGIRMWSQETYFKTPAEFKYLTLKNEYNGENTLTITKNGTPASEDLSYSVDNGNTWIDIHNGGSVDLKVGMEILLKSTTGMNKSINNYYKINMSEIFSVSGHIASLFGYTTATMTAIPDYGCCYLFSTSFTLISANIDFTGITTIGEYSCYAMFSNCSALTTAPDMSNVTTIRNRACQNMFASCSRLATPPDMSSVTTIGDSGCNGAFYYCSRLATPPDMSSVTTIGDTGCGGMFTGCSLLTKTPDLSGVKSIGDSGCGGMFYSCTSLTTPPVLSGVSSIGNDGFSYMFHGCTSLTTGTDLSGVTTIGTNGCMGMYRACFRLSSVTTPNIDTWDTSKFSNWLLNAGTSATGTKTVYKPSALSIPIDSDSGVPVGWVVDDYN